MEAAAGEPGSGRGSEGWGRVIQDFLKTLGPTLNLVGPARIEYGSIKGSAIKKKNKNPCTWCTVIRTERGRPELRGAKGPRASSMGIGIGKGDRN